MLVGGLCLLSGCKKQAASSGLFPVTLQTDWYPQPEHGGFYEALLKGYYKQEGLDVTISPGGPMIIGDQQVASGAATFAMESSDQVLVSVSHGLPLVAVAATLQRDPQGVMVHRDSPVKSFADLNGHAVSVRPGSIWFQYLVKKYNLNDVREIPATFSVANFLADPNYIQQAFVTSEPYFAKKGGAEVRMLQVSDTGYVPYRVYVTSQSFCEGASRRSGEVCAGFDERMAGLHCRSKSGGCRDQQAKSGDECRPDGVQRADTERDEVRDRRWAGWRPVGKIYAEAMGDNVPAACGFKGDHESN